jgi:hypothetical protein
MSEQLLKTLRKSGDFQAECEDSTRLGGIESFSVVDVKTMRRQCKCNARAVRMAASSVSTVADVPSARHQPLAR